MYHALGLKTNESLIASKLLNVWQTENENCNFTRNFMYNLNGKYCLYFIYAKCISDIISYIKSLPRCQIHVSMKSILFYSVCLSAVVVVICCFGTKTSSSSTKTTTIINNIQKEFVQLSTILFSVSTLSHTVYIVWLDCNMLFIEMEFAILFTMVYLLFYLVRVQLLSLLH